MCRNRYFHVENPLAVCPWGRTNHRKCGSNFHQSLALVIFHLSLCRFAINDSSGRLWRMRSSESDTVISSPLWATRIWSLLIQVSRHMRDGRRIDDICTQTFHVLICHLITLFPYQRIALDTCCLVLPFEWDCSVFVASIQYINFFYFFDGNFPAILQG